MVTCSTKAVIACQHGAFGEEMRPHYTSLTGGATPAGQPIVRVEPPALHEHAFHPLRAVAPG